MKRRNAIFCILAALAFVITACTSTGSKTGQGTAKSLENLSDLLQKAELQVTDTVTSLNDLVDNPSADLRPQYATFNKSFDAMKKSASQIGDVADKMKEKGNEYFPEWKSNLSSIQNEKLRKKLEKRNGQLLEQFQDIVKEFGKLKGNYQPFVAQIEDVKTALDNDLTESGLKLVKSLVGDIEDDSEDVIDNLQNMSEQFTAFSEELSPILQQAANQ